MAPLFGVSAAKINRLRRDFGAPGFDLAGGASTLF
jgi:hypothetical protein